MEKRKFDLIFSLGHRCYTSMMLRQNNLQVNSFPFDWLLNTKYKESIEFLCNNFENFLEKEDLELTENIGNEFHTPYKNKRNDYSLVHDFPVNVDFDTQFEVVKEKYSKRAKRLIEKIKSSKNVLLVFRATASDGNFNDAINDTKEMIPKLKEVFPTTVFSFMYIIPSETKGYYYCNNDLNLEIIEKPPIDDHKRIKILGIKFSVKTNEAPESLQNCRLNKSFSDRYNNVMYWIQKLGRRLIPSKKLKSYFAERKY